MLKNPMKKKVFSQRIEVKKLSSQKMKGLKKT